MGNALANAGMLVVHTLFGLYLLIVLLRFFMQIARVDFYNPLSQSIVKITNPVVAPLRRAIPSISGYDTSSLLLAFVVQILAIFLLCLLQGYPINSITNTFIVWPLLGLLTLSINIYTVALIISIIGSFVAPMSQNPILLIVNQLISPALAPFRKILPSMGGLDFSPIFLILTIQLTSILVVYPIAQHTQLYRGLISMPIFG